MDHFTIAARLQGKRRTVAVHVYETQAQMVDAAKAFNGVDTPDAEAVTQAFWAEWNPQAVIRFCHPHMSEHIRIHELTHAAQVIYRWTADMDSPAAEHFTHYNEDFAHLISDLHLALRDALDKRYTITSAR